MTAPARTVTLDQFLTRAELDRALVLWEQHRARRHVGAFATAVEAELIIPNLARINKALGQENDSRYLAYCIEYVLGRM